MKTDSQIQQDVIDELKWEPAVDATDIGVEVKDGIVTLAGHVSNYAGKWNAGSAAQRVYGVKAVVMEIDVTLAGSTRRTDADIVRSARDILQWTTDAPADSVLVKVEKGMITLSGVLAWEYQRRDAAEAVRNLLGVRGVINSITLQPGVASSVVKEDIEAALTRSGRPDNKGINVEVDGARVTLTGSVHNRSERDLANNAAWAAPGVRSVVDQMGISY
jgi:osmotically-inducible protein OsmY